MEPVSFPIPQRKSSIRVSDETGEKINAMRDKIASLNDTKEGRKKGNHTPAVANHSTSPRDSPGETLIPTPVAHALDAETSKYRNQLVLLRRALQAASTVVRGSDGRCLSLD